MGGGAAAGGAGGGAAACPRASKRNPPKWQRTSLPLLQSVGAAQPPQRPFTHRAKGH